MVKLSENDTKHVAKLAHLTLTDDEVKKYQSQLSSIVSYIEELGEVNTDGIEPTSQTTGLENVTREDEVRPTGTLTVKEATSGTDKIHNDYFLVPMVLEERTV